MSVGTIFVNEVPYPIRRIFLRGGRIYFETVAPGPLVLPRDTEVRVHDPQGNLVWVGPWTLDRGAARAASLAIGGMVTIELPVQITAVKNWPRDRKAIGV